MTIPMPGPPECECATCEGCAEERHEGLMREGEPCPACHVHAGPSYREEKRLKEAECAAEYWRASNMCWRTDALGLEDPAGTDLEYESYTWLAFATCPHALEES